MVLSPLKQATLDAEARLNTLNALIGTDDNDVFVIASKALYTTVQTLNDEERAAQFAAMLSNDNPIMDAIRRGILIFTTVKTPTKKSPVFRFDTGTEIIDIMELADLSPNDTGIFANCKAGLFIESLNRLILSYELKQGDGNASKKWDKFNMTLTAETLLGTTLKDITYGEDFDEVVQKVANTLVDGVIVDRRDVAYWVGKYAAFSKTINAVKASKDGAFRRQFMRLLNKTVTGEKWLVD
jgi:hypothetical protein